MLEPSRAPRPVYVFDLPEELAGQDEHVKQSVGLVKLTLDEEMQALARAAGDSIKMAYYCARASLVEIDGRKLNKGEAEDESVLRHADPVIRQLIVAAYGEISTTSEENSKKFLASKRVKVE